MLMMRVFRADKQRFWARELVQWLQVTGAVSLGLGTHHTGAQYMRWAGVCSGVLLVESVLMHSILQAWRRQSTFAAQLSLNVLLLR